MSLNRFMIQKKTLEEVTRVSYECRFIHRSISNQNLVGIGVGLGLLGLGLLGLGLLGLGLLGLGLLGF